MKLLTVIFIALLPLISSAQQKDNFLVTSKAFGKITAATTFNDLKKIFGAANCKDELAYGPEGMDSFTVTRIFPNTSKEIVVYWAEKKFHKSIASVDTYAKGSPYHTAEGIKVGTTLDKLLKANGKPINFYGTGWDYGGLITSYNNGKFEGSTIFFSLADLPGLPSKLMGDSEFNTGMSLVKKNLTKLFVSKISLSFSAD